MSRILNIMFKKLNVFLIFGLLFFISNSAYAEYFKITNYEVNINIHKNAVIDVEEIISVKFSALRHGIYRDIPYKYNVTPIADKKADRFGVFGKTYKINIINIETPGFENKVTKRGRYIRIRIGSKNKYARTNETYTIRYSVLGAINFFKDSSEFYWNIIGTKWKVNIEHVDFTVTFPEYTPDENQVIAVKGFYGDTDKIENLNIGNRIVSGSINETLSPGTAVTVGIKFPKDLIKLSTFQKLKIMLFNNASYFIPVIVFIPLFILWFLLGKDKKVVKVTHFYPPKDMTSAEAGVLIDDSVDDKDLISLIFYWAANGLIEMEEIEKEGFFDKKDFILTKLKDLPENAKPFERTIFYGLFPGSTGNVRISTLKNNFYSYMEQAKKELNDEISNRHLYEPGTRLLGKIIMGAAFIFLMGVGVSIALKRYDYSISLGISTIITFFFGYIMPKKSQRGLEKYRILQGFADFIERVEKPKLKVLLKQDPSYFEKTIPYAIALNVMDKWTKKFDGLLSEPPRWYHGTTGSTFNAALFATSLNHSISTMNSTFVSKPSSSGAGSGGSIFSGGGGGFSGGGFGGGGGGSW